MPRDLEETDKKHIDPDLVVFKIILGQMGTTGEGSDLADYARAKNIDFKFVWSNSAAQWKPDENAMHCSKDITNERLIGAIASQLRRASQQDLVPDLVNIDDERLHKTSLKKQILLLRLTEGDAKSYEIAMRVALEKSGVITDAAASFAGILREEAEALDTDEVTPRGISPEQVEVYRYVKSFREKFGDDPFSPQARADAFYFLQTSKYFANDYDQGTVTRLAMDCSAYVPTKAAFGYAAKTPLPDFPTTALTISSCKTSPKAGGYLTLEGLMALEGVILASLHPSLKEMIGKTESLSLSGTAKNVYSGPKG